MLARLATSTGKKAEDSEAALEKYLHTVLAVENTLTLDRLRQVWRYSHIRTLALIRLDVSRQVMHCVQTGEVSGLIGISVGNYFLCCSIKRKKTHFVSFHCARAARSQMACCYSHCSRNDFHSSSLLQIINTSIVSLS